MLGFEPLQAEGNGHVIFRININIGAEKIIPRALKCLDRDHHQRRLDQRQNDRAVNAKMAASVYFGGIFQRQRNGHHELPQQENAEGVPEQRSHPQRLERVVPADFIENQKYGNHRHLRRKHHRGQQQNENNVPAAPANARKSVRDKTADQHVENHIQNRDVKRVPNPEPKRDKFLRALEIMKNQSPVNRPLRKHARNPAHGNFKYFLGLLETGHDQPEKGQREQNASQPNNRMQRCF